MKKSMSTQVGKEGMGSKKPAAINANNKGNALKPDTTKAGGGKRNMPMVNANNTKK